jgi:predicted nucleotidyltransferase
MRTRIPVERDAINRFCKRHHVCRFWFFGSVLRDDFGPDSDIDVLVEFEPEHVPGFIRLYEIEAELSAILGGRKVDLVTPRFLNRRIRDRVLAEAEVQYGQG